MGRDEAHREAAAPALGFIGVAGVEDLAGVDGHLAGLEAEVDHVALVDVFVGNFLVDAEQVAVAF